MKTKRDRLTIHMELSTEEAALVANYVSVSRQPAMEELFERLLGSPRWKQIRPRQHTVHPELISDAEYTAALEKNHL